MSGLSGQFNVAKHPAMQYAINIAPEKEELFLQLLSIWRELGVINSYARFATDDEDLFAEPLLPEHRGEQWEKNEIDLLAHYRDLVD